MNNVKSADAGLLQSRYRLTRQRAAVLRALGDGSHLSADTVLDRVRAEIPGVSLGTIYRTLDILRELGLVQIFSYAGQAARYEAALDKHHHLLCSGCQRLSNIEVPEIEALARGIADRSRYSDVDSSLTVVGLCAACATQGTRRGTAHGEEESTSAGLSSNVDGSSP